MKIVLLHRVLVAYREPLFEEMREQARQAGHTFELFVSTASVEFARRGTEGRLPWVRSLAVKALPTWLGGLEYQVLPWREVLAADVVIVPDIARSVSNMLVLLARRVLGKTVVTWGHGANFQPDALSRLLSSLRFSMLRLAHGHLVYTQICKAALEAAGFDRGRIGISENAIDDFQAKDLHGQHPEVLAFREDIGLGDAPCIVFLGSWYARKRPEAVVEIGLALRKQVPQARVLVIGGGDGLAVLGEHAKELPWLTLVGPLHGREKFVALAAGRCLVVSGVAGLNLLDAMAVGLPVVLPQKVDHSPEVVYVINDVNGLVVSDDGAQMAEACSRLIGDRTLHAKLSKGAYQTSAERTVKAMAANILRYAMTLGKKIANTSGSAKVIHVASSHKIGLSAQETELAIAYKKLNYFDLLVVSGEKEQVEGCFRNLTDSNIKNVIINGFDDHHEFISHVRSFIKQCNEFQPKIVTLNTNWQLLIVGVARAFCRTKFKIVYTIHGFRNNRKLLSYFAQFFIGILLYLFADVINAPTSYVATKFRLLKSKIFSIPLGEDRLFFNESKNIQLNPTLGIIFPGQFRVGKNQDILICAVYEYMAQTGDRDVILYLPGSGDLLPSVEQLAKKLGISDSVIFPGQLNRVEILELYNKCQIAIVPTNSETFGHCIAEPLVLQKILITKGVGVAIDVIKNGENGFFFESKEDLVNYLKKIRKMNAEEILRISKNAKVTGEIFRWENVASRHYNEVFKKYF